MRLRTVTFIGLTLGAALLLASCGGGGDTPTPGDENPSATPAGSQLRLDACSLLTEGEASEILGQPVTSLGNAVLVDVDSCLYQPPDAQAGATQLLIQVRSGVDVETFQQVIATSATALGQEAQEVSGVGDAAFFLGGILSVHNDQSQVQVWIAYPGLAQSDLVGKLKAAAAKAIERLP